MANDEITRIYEELEPMQWADLAGTVKYGSSALPSAETYHFLMERGLIVRVAPPDSIRMPRLAYYEATELGIAVVEYEKDLMEWLNETVYEAVPEIKVRQLRLFDEESESDG